MKIEKLVNGLYKVLIDFNNAKQQVEIIDDLDGLQIFAHNILEKIDRYRKEECGDEQLIRVYTVIKVPDTPYDREQLAEFEKELVPITDIYDFIQFRKNHPKETN